MIINSQINTILNKEMDRKDFLKYMAASMIAVSGFSAALRALSANKATPALGTTMSNYGAASYGGIKNGK